jgi:hypothetical protein
MLDLIPLQDNLGDLVTWRPGQDAMNLFPEPLTSPK